MNNLLPGILTISICAIGYIFSWRCWLKENYKVGVLLLIVCGLAIRIFAASDAYVHKWDESFHALVAKNLIQHPLTPTLYENPLVYLSYKEWTGNHIWLSKPPFPLWLIAASISVFGTNEFALRLPSVLLSLFGVWLTFYLTSLLFNRKIAFVSAFLYSINGLLIELVAGKVSSDHVENCFIIMVELSILFSVLSILKKKQIWLILSGITMGIAIMCKWTPAFIVLPVYASMFFYSREFSYWKLVKNLFILLFFSLIISLPWHIYILDKYSLEGKEMLKSFFNPMGTIIQNHSGPPWFYIERIWLTFGEIVYIPILWFLWKSYKLVELRSLSVWLLLPLLIFSIAETKRLTYILIVAPAVFMMIAYYFCHLYEIRNSYKYKWLLWTILVLLILLPLRYMVERTKPFSSVNRNPLWAADLRTLNEKNIQNGVLFNYNKPIEAMFYTNLNAYSSTPEIDKLLELKNKGYKILINDNENIPSRYKSVPGIIIVKLRDSN